MKIAESAKYCSLATRSYKFLSVKIVQVHHDEKYLYSPCFRILTHFHDIMKIFLLSSSTSHIMKNEEEIRLFPFFPKKLINLWGYWSFVIKGTLQDLKKISLTKVVFVKRDMQSKSSDRRAKITKSSTLKS